MLDSTANFDKKMEISAGLKQAYIEARSRLKLLTDQITEPDLSKRLASVPNSIGFLLRHIGDVELLFAKNVFKATEIDVKARTVIDKKDTGEWINLDELVEYLEKSNSTITKIIENQLNESWDELITTNEFGTKTKIEAFGRIISHTAYHTGQVALLLKYGNLN
jgi:uncharacterized damage-inducible protein DinB